MACWAGRSCPAAPNSYSWPKALCCAAGAPCAVSIWRRCLATGGEKKRRGKLGVIVGIDDRVFRLEVGQ